MLPERIEETRDWLGKAAQDSTAAQLLASAKPPLIESALYHCQQAAEKALKAYLTWRDRPFPRTHNLVAPLTICVDVEPGCEALADAAAVLTPYAVSFRYPGEATSPTYIQYLEAIGEAERVLSFVLSRMPPEVRV